MRDETRAGDDSDSIYLERQFGLEPVRDACKLGQA